MLNIDFRRLVASANQDSEFPRAARYWNGLLAFTIGADTTVLRAVDGRIELASAGSVLGAHDIQIAAAARDWEMFLRPVPPAGWHDFFNSKSFTVSADMLDFGPYYAAIRRLTALMTEQLHGPRPSATVTQPPPGTHDDAVGRYVYLDVQGSTYRVYYESTGQGIPLVLLHTAGADSRQYRHLLENQDLQDRYRLIAVDLPYHGRSLPPTTKEWWKEQYLLTRDFLLEFFDTFNATLSLERPVFMGCSVGGMLAPDLAYYRPGVYRAVIALNGALAMPEANLAKPDKEQSWYHPRVTSEWKASSMLGFMAPHSPEVYRRETAWVYSQSSPPVFAGDIHYYMRDHVLTAEQAATIDTALTGVYLLTGEYDPLAMSGLSQRLADAVPGSHFEINEAIGHFGPAENPEAFWAAVEPVLEEIALKFPN
ncbi:alpha/beta fold hydrolase [Nocardioides immobilis]|nr:alpha/beta hydrolase [Nocardioides immobilis]